ncbi:unnamed protein product (macronuclear) [Paramecium tetraurelia]|uniref:Uncharacterized protein n=1 Tax=Paramecium tetraurelia TaxID=5888 RepID=A0CZ37_PARTE|nr:uncharacterized protein GSPATT00011655001 [Paramecium tetraurelia]CAK76054.1 unnamed protein product [Paramecium tetraurelia]|eukprot:XP_001443451.1 hypothetical protein (macronuclear) [Paramecium tetraurelia strain d4-2]
MDSTNVEEISLDYLSNTSVEKDRGISQTVQNQQEFDNLNEDFQNLEIVLEINDIMNDIWNIKLAEKYEKSLQYYRDYKIIINKLDKYFKNNIEKTKIFMYLTIDKQIKYTEEIANFFYYLLMKDVKRIQAKHIIKYLEYSAEKPIKVDAFQIFADKCNISLSGYNLSDYKKKPEKTRQIQISYKQQDIVLFQKNTITLLDILYRNQYNELGIAIDLLMIGDFSIEEVVNAKGQQVESFHQSYIFRIYQQTFLNMHKTLELRSKWFHKGTQLQLDTFHGQNVHLVSLPEGTERRSRLTQRLNIAKGQILSKGYYQNNNESLSFYSYLKNLKVDQIK